ncbi:MAG: hypothetical protein OEW19_12160 [Acidobacteriota bacterium]|nr:hypothetical protein [Acidobacteriota bacterium]
MLKARTVSRPIGLTAALAVAVCLFAQSNLEAQSQSEGATVVGTWFLSAPDLEGFYTFHQGGTVSGVVNPDRANIAGALRGVDHGVWKRRGRGFEFVVYRFVFPADTGIAQAITRIRLVLNLDPGFESGFAEFFITQWFCNPTPGGCPDPNLSDPDRPEFAPPGNTLRMTRVRLD